MTSKTINNGNGPVVGAGQVLGVVPVRSGGEQAPVADESGVAASVAAVLDPQLVARLAAQARAQGVNLLGCDGLLQQLTKRFLEATLEAEMDEHFGYGKHEPTGRDGGNSRNGYRSKTLFDRGRAGGYRGAAGSGRQLRPADCG